MDSLTPMGLRLTWVRPQIEPEKETNPLRFRMSLSLHMESSCSKETIKIRCLSTFNSVRQTVGATFEPLCSVLVYHFCREQSRS